MKNFKDILEAKKELLHSEIILNETKNIGTKLLAKKLLNKLADAKLDVSRFDIKVGGIDKNKRNKLHDLLADAIEIIKEIK